MKISKSKRQLAQLLIEAGIDWPKSATHIAQDRDTVAYFFSGAPSLEKGKGGWSGVAIRRILLTQLVAGWHSSALSRAEFDKIVAESAEQVKPDADGWIEWKGGECPVDDGELVQVRYREDDGSGMDASEAVKFYWRHENKCYDIIAYRPHKPGQAEPQYCESVTRSIPEPVTAPTLDQLLQDYRNASDFAAAKQDEADEAAKMRDERWKAAQARACELGVHISVELVVDAEMREFEPVITDWRDLRVGDVIALTGNSVELEAGEYEVCDTEGVSYQGKYSIRVSAGELGRRWISNDSWRFIRRP